MEKGQGTGRSRGVLLTPVVALGGAEADGSQGGTRFPMQPRDVTDVPCKQEPVGICEGQRADLSRGFAGLLLNGFIHV